MGKNMVSKEATKSPTNPLCDYPQITHPAMLTFYRQVSKKF